MKTDSGLNGLRWLPTLRRYLAFVLLVNLAWEFAQLPLYTIWQTAPLSELIFVAAHCTLGDVIIATMALMLTLLLIGDATWPQAGYWRVALLTTAAGLAYTIYSEWLNVSVRASWAYAPAMPVVPLLGIGLSPLLQWLVIPPLAFWYAGQGAPAH